MIIQPVKGTRNVKDLFYEAERKRIDMLSRDFFHDVELTKKEVENQNQTHNVRKEGIAPINQKR